MKKEQIWAAILQEAPRHNMDSEYLIKQVHLLGLDEARFSQLWQVCEEHAESALDLLAAFEYGVLTRQQVEQVLAGKLPIERVRLFLSDFRQHTADTTEVLAT